MVLFVAPVGFPVAQVVKNPPAVWETWVGEIPWRRERLPTPVFWPGDVGLSMSLLMLKMGFPGGSVVKNPPANAGDAGDTGSIPGLGRSPEGGHGNPL